ncbi:MAG: hypothetical protein MZW92_70495 [Comamonadaceae bacterium]|nr:hypothetical protein [Comamonadaceae bacterium]
MRIGGRRRAARRPIDAAPTRGRDYSAASAATPRRATGAARPVDPSGAPIIGGCAAPATRSPSSRCRSPPSPATLPILAVFAARDRRPGRRRHLVAPRADGAARLPRRTRCCSSCWSAPAPASAAPRPRG